MNEHNENDNVSVLICVFALVKCWYDENMF